MKPNRKNPGERAAQPGTKPRALSNASKTVLGQFTQSVEQTGYTDELLESMIQIAVTVLDIEKTLDLCCRNRELRGKDYKPMRVKLVFPEMTLALESIFTDNCVQFAKRRRGKLTVMASSKAEMPATAWYDISYEVFPGDQDSFGWLVGVTSVEIKDQFGSCLATMGLIWG